ncbi:hypothetical protein G9A89_011750 [Geosiphon pyriformis]|nr:hypothetical protein G9A89_011750 [Geosiphon pyriformis]
MDKNTLSHSHQSREKLRPFVHYHCACPDVYASDLDYSPSPNDPPSVNSPRIQHSTFSITKLYFCEDCHQIRCPRCVQEEIVCYYCPNCLFEVPTASVKSERNRCARNCFQCPICQNTLSVVASTEPPLASPVTSTPQPVVAQTGGAPFYLFCSVCRWDSQEIGMTFEKATGLALQLQKTEDDRADVKEFDHLKEHFEKHLRMNAPSTTLPTQLLSIPGMSSFSSRYGGTGLAHAQQKSDDVNPYDAVVNVKDDEKLLDDLIHLDNVNLISTFSQRTNQLSDQPYRVEKLQPQRIHLRTKRVKRCRSCRHILIKPEQKAQATKFKIKLVALNYIPKITVAKLPPLILQQTVQVVLKFSNPHLDDIIVSLSAKEEIEDYGKVKLLATNFNIGPYNELLEYDDEEFSTEKLTSRSRPASRASFVSKPDPGIVEKKGNYTSVIVEITPLKETDEFKFPLLVTHTRKVLDTDNVETSEPQPRIVSNAESTVDKITKNDDDINNFETSTIGINPALAESEPPFKRLHFWTVIGLGTVLKEPLTPTPVSNKSSQLTVVSDKSSTTDKPISSTAKPTSSRTASSIKSASSSKVSTSSSNNKSGGATPSLQTAKPLKKSTTVHNKNL